jgi:YaiO family outer membrane protein
VRAQDLKRNPAARPAAASSGTRKAALETARTSVDSQVSIIRAWLGRRPSGPSRRDPPGPIAEYPLKGGRRPHGGASLHAPARVSPDMSRERILVALLVASSYARAQETGSTPAASPAAAVTNSEALKQQARRFVWDTRYDDAEAAYARVLERDPHDAEAGAGQARVFARMHRMQAAEELARGVLDREPKAFEARLVLAEILLSTQRAEEALTEFEAAGAIDSMDPRSALGRSRALADCGREDESRAADEATASWLSQRLASQPGDLEVRLARAQALLRLERPQEALVEYQDVLRREPRNREANLGCARALLRLDRPGPALARVDEMLDEDPDVAEAHGLRGTVELRQGRSVEGEAAFARAVELDRWNPEYRLGVARCRWARSDLAGARAACAEALALEPENAEVPELLARIDASPPPGDFRLWTGLRYDHLSGDRDDWWQETVHLTWRAREDLVLGIGADAYQRYGEDDVQISADCTWRFHEDWTWANTLVYGPGAETVARGAFDTEIARRLGATTTGSLRWRHSEFSGDVRVDLLSPGVEFACGPECSLLVRYYLVDDSQTGRGDGGAMRLSIAPERRLLGRLGIAYGSETFLTNTPDAATSDSEVFSFSAGFEWRASDRVHLRFDYDYEDHESAYVKQGVALGLAFDL